MKELQWFETWFSSPYYQILYKDRDPEEAQYFMRNILDFLKPEPRAKILDMACGVGRHAIFLADQQMDVTGIDLASESIAEAKAHEHELLHFHVHDMRSPFRKAYFDYVFNLFTSFGYFEDAGDNLRTVQAIAANLKPGGKALIDFLNPCRVIETLVPHEVKQVDGIEFIINRRAEDNLIVKDIEFSHDGDAFHFQERVVLLERDQFIDYFRRSGMSLVETFGDYDLEPYAECDSERLILIAERE